MRALYLDTKDSIAYEVAYEGEYRWLTCSPMQ